jgi:hypothetical protein
MDRAKHRNEMASSGGNFVAPILGAAGGTLVVTIAVEKFKIKRPVAAFGTAALSLIAARSAKGAARAGLEAAAIASICIGVAEVLARLKKPNQQSAASPVQPSKSSVQPQVPPDAVTSSELRNALATIKAKHEADVAERMASIYPLLDEHERRRWSSMVATMPPEELAQIQRELMRRTPDEGVTFLRSSVLATALRLPS